MDKVLRYISRFLIYASVAFMFFKGLFIIGEATSYPILIYILLGPIGLYYNMLMVYENLAPIKDLTQTEVKEIRKVLNGD